MEKQQNWQKEILNSFAYNLHNGYIEGINNQTKIIKRATRAIPIVGTAVDFGIQVYQGENATDAAIKAVSHTTIALGGAATGAKIGAAIGTAIAPGVGTAIGVGVGFVIGVAGSMGFDASYDFGKEKVVNAAKEIGETVTNAGKEIGGAVQGLFRGLGTVFG